MPTFNDIMAARNALNGYIYETPVIVSNALRERTGHEQVFLKCENLQRTGSYHIRGHMYRVIRAKEADLGINHFVTYSTANGGQALACAGKSFQSTVDVVVPDSTPELITRAIIHYKGNYHRCKPTADDRIAKVRELMECSTKGKNSDRSQTVFVHPYDDDYVIAGHGTAGVELMLQTDCNIDCVLVPVGGGALLSGVAIAVRGMKPHVAVFAAELVVQNGVHQDFKRGELVVHKEVSSSLMPAESSGLSLDLQTPLTARTMNNVKSNVNGVIKVSEEEMQQAFRYVYERCKLVVDQHSATAVAALLKCPRELKKYRRIGIILSGGNVDLHDIPRMAGAKL